MLTPKSWDTFQHYKKRRPVWIKLHRSLLDDYEYSCLPLASRALAPMLWLIASEYPGGHIPLTLDAIAFRLHTTVDELSAALKPLIDSGNFISASGLLADRKQLAMLERETETETEREGEEKAPPRRASRGAHLLPAEWTPNQKHEDLAMNRALSSDDLSEAAAEMRDWSIGNGMKRTNWDAAFSNWLRRDARKKRTNTDGKAQHNVAAAAQRLIDRAVDFGDRPSLSRDSGEEGGAAPGLLPQR